MKSTYISNTYQARTIIVQDHGYDQQYLILGTYWTVHCHKDIVGIYYKCFTLELVTTCFASLTTAKFPLPMVFSSSQYPTRTRRLTNGLLSPAVGRGGVRAIVLAQLSQTIANGLLFVDIYCGFFFSVFEFYLKLPSLFTAEKFDKKKTPRRSITSRDYLCPPLHGRAKSNKSGNSTGDGGDDHLLRRRRQQQR